MSKKIYSAQKLIKKYQKYYLEDVLRDPTLTALKAYDMCFVQGFKLGVVEILQNLLISGMSISDIALATKFSQEDVTKIAEELHAVGWKVTKH